MKLSSTSNQPDKLRMQCWEKLNSENTKNTLQSFLEQRSNLVVKEPQMKAMKGSSDHQRKVRKALVIRAER